MQPAVETIGDDSEMKTPKPNEETSFIDVERYRGLVHTFIGLVSRITCENRFFSKFLH